MKTPSVFEQPVHSNRTCKKMSRYGLRIHREASRKWRSPETCNNRSAEKLARFYQAEEIRCIDYATWAGSI